MNNIEQTAKGWRICHANAVMDIVAKTGSLSSFVVKKPEGPSGRREASAVYGAVAGSGGAEKVWTPHAGGVTVRDDIIRKTFGSADLQKVDFLLDDQGLRSAARSGSRT